MEVALGCTDPEPRPPDLQASNAPVVRDESQIVSERPKS